MLNGSDNTLLDTFMDPVLGCTPFQAPDLANNSQPTSSQALDELLAEKNKPRMQALVPENDEMTLDGAGQFDVAKTNLYRAELGQAPISAANNRSDSPAEYCQNMVNVQTPFLAGQPGAAGDRPVAGDRGGQQPVHLPGEPAQHVLHQPGLPELRPHRPGHGHAERNGAAVAATFNTAQQTARDAAADRCRPGAARRPRPSRADEPVGRVARGRSPVS